MLRSLKMMLLALFSIALVGCGAQDKKSYMEIHKVQEQLNVEAEKMKVELPAIVKAREYEKLSAHSKNMVIMFNQEKAKVEAIKATDKTKVLKSKMIEYLEFEIKFAAMFEELSKISKENDVAEYKAIVEKYAPIIKDEMKLLGELNQAGRAVREQLK